MSDRLSIQQVPLADIHPAPWNVRTGHAVEAIAESITINGFRDPIEVWRKTGEIVAGEGRYRAAEFLLLEDVPVIFHDFDSLASAKRYAIANNRLTERSEWDLPALSEQLGELDSLAGTGFDEDPTLDEEGGLASVVEDEAPEAQEEAVTGPGDLWLLGEHRVLCGDATSAQDVGRIMDGRRSDLCFTSPPYNLGTTTGGGFPARGGLWQTSGLEEGYGVCGDALPQDEYQAQQSDLLSMLWEDVLSDDGAIFYNHRPRVQNGELLTPFLWNPGLPVRQVVIWASGSGVNFAPTHYRPAHEWIVIFAKPSFRLQSKSASGCGDVWSFPAATRDGGHPAPFPVELPARAIDTTGASLTFDPFLGSGTTLVAAEQLGRTCYGLEIEPRYVDVIVKRWQNLTGREATLEATGETFAERAGLAQEVPA